MGGYFPKTKKRFTAVLNSKKNCYEIIDTKENIVFRSKIGTRKDAENQLVSLNFR